MQVQELRNRLDSAERGNLEKAFVECYKQLRKAQKEECDQALIALLEGNAAEQGMPANEKHGMFKGE